MDEGFTGAEQSAIQDLGAVTAKGEKTAIHCLTIVGQVVCVDNDRKFQQFLGIQPLIGRVFSHSFSR
jgi:hypothetical protein